MRRLRIQCEGTRPLIMDPLRKEDFILRGYFIDVDLLTGQITPGSRSSAQPLSVPPDSSNLDHIIDKKSTM